MISLISSDEEDDDEPMPASTSSGIKRKLRPITDDSKYAKLGQMCADESRAARQQEATTKQALENFNATMGYLHSDYATQIQDKEEELARLRDDADDKQKCIDDSMNEIARLRAELKAQQTQAAADLAAQQAQAAADLAAEQARASSAAAPASVLKGGQEVLEAILDDVMKDLQAKEANLKTAAPAPTASSSTPPSATLWIQQKNIDPQFLTVREVQYQPPKRGSTHGKWYFDASDKKNNPSATDSWIEITDPATVAELAKLGRMTKVKKQLTLQQGKKVTYKHGNHTYEVEVVRSVRPWDLALSQAPPPPPSTTGTTGAKMLLDGPFFAPPKSQFKAYMDELNIHEGMHEVVGHQALADLATYWSSFSYGFKYDATKTELWVKPQWLASWLTVAQTRGDFEVRVVGHGVRSGDFASLAKDPAGFNLAYSREGRVGFGCYVSPLDCIPADYTSAGGTHPDGTMVLGLLLVFKSSTPTTGTSTSANSYQAQNGAYDFYHLGSGRSGYLASSYTVNDAYNVRDQTLLLPLGKVVGV